MGELSKGPLKKVDKVWGFEEWWINESEYCFKILVLKPGFQSSKHYHPKKKETFLVLKGLVFLQVWETKDRPTLYNLIPETQVTIQPGWSHKFWVNGSNPAVVYEISTHHDDADVVRQSQSGVL